MPASSGRAGPSFAPAAAGPRRRAIKGQIVFDEATARRLRRIRWRRTGALMSIVALIAAAIALYFLPLLRVHNVEVAGAEHVDPQQIADLASFEGDSMLRLDTVPAGERIDFLPLVKSVQIERHWPQTVRIVVTERTPWAFWQVGDAQYVIDDEGVVLPNAQPPEGSPAIKDLTNPIRLAPGDHVDLDAVILTRTLLQRVPEALALNISAFEYSTEKGLALLTDAGYRVVVGDSQNMDYKLGVWKAIEGHLGRESMSGHVLDLRFQDRPSFQ
jgi:cell division protein FtsQ